LTPLLAKLIKVSSAEKNNKRSNLADIVWRKTLEVKAALSNFEDGSMELSTMRILKEVQDEYEKFEDKNAIVNADFAALFDEKIASQEFQ
jgi:hypothetical protein